MTASPARRQLRPPPAVCPGPGAHAAAIAIARRWLGRWRAARRARLAGPGVGGRQSRARRCSRRGPLQHSTVRVKGCPFQAPANQTTFEPEIRFVRLVLNWQAECEFPVCDLDGLYWPLTPDSANKAPGKLAGTLSHFEPRRVLIAAGFVNGHIPAPDDLVIRTGG